MYFVKHQHGTLKWPLGISLEYMYSMYMVVS